MPPSIVWFSGLIVVTILELVIITTVLFFLRRIRQLGQWQDIYLTLTYIILGINVLGSFANLLVIPFFGQTQTADNILQVFWTIALLCNMAYALPLAAFVKMTFRSKSSIASFFAQLVMLIGGYSLFAVLFISFSPVWDEATWMILYVYDNMELMFLATFPILFTTLWFSYEAFKLYLRERRKDSPNPLQLRRFSFLALSGVTLLIFMGVASIAFGGYTHPSEIDPFLALVLYWQPALIGFFVVLSYMGWVMPSFAKRGIRISQQGGV